MRVQENTKGCLPRKEQKKKDEERKKIIGVYGKNKGSAFLLSVAFQACSRMVDRNIIMADFREENDKRGWKSGDNFEIRRKEPLHRMKIVYVNNL